MSKLMHLKYCRQIHTEYIRQQNWKGKSPLFLDKESSIFHLNKHMYWSSLLAFQITILLPLFQLYHLSKFLFQQVASRTNTAPISPFNQHISRTFLQYNDKQITLFTWRLPWLLQKYLEIWVVKNSWISKTFTSKSMSSR